MMEMVERVRYCLIMTIYNKAKHIDKVKLYIKQCYGII